MAANNAAAHQVFAIPERLEHNLTYLDILELLRCQQVCNTFLTTTFASPKLQKRLTYRALASSTLSHKHAKPIYNPLFYNFQGIWANYHDMRSSGKSREWVLRRHVQSEEKMPPFVTEGSWKMYLERFDGSTRRHWLPKALLFEMNGPTMGEVVDELRRRKLLN